MIKSFDIKSVEAKRFINEYSLPNMRISNKSMITNIVEKEESIGIDFVFIVEYNPNLASIKIEGSLIYSGEDSKDIFASWKDKKNDKRIQKIQMSIVQRCLIESVILAKEINVVPPIPLPNMQEKKKDYGAMFG
ncbi:MAG: hypothetical protein J7J21_03485 [Methanomicrobia archaeon]|nr:hypothetical protein [Methanomicrobia archaeon]HDM22408.1 hypothetical protein [Methanomicrobia archaeon]